MVGSCGADASMVASWVGWIRTLASVLVVSLGGIVSSAGVMGLDGFKEVRNGMRGFMCVISVRGLSSLDAWLWGSIGIFTISLGFAKCFCTSFCSLEAMSYSQREKKKHFRSPFWSLKIILQSFWSLEIISQPFGSLEIIWQQNGNFAAHSWSLEHFRT